jgi:phenylpyruvate tautomerase PptA (4-oxalocrotonate tautomerase family)
MPYISIAMGKELSQDQKDRLAHELGRLITIIPGKTEKGLIVHFHDGALYKGGEEIPCAYIDLRVYTKTTEEAKQGFTKETCAYIAKEFGVPVENQYLTIQEFDNWGSRGEWH